MLPNQFKCTVAIIGLGYVGLPLALEISKTKRCIRTGKSLSRSVIGFDLNQKRIKDLMSGFDITNEANKEDILQAKNIEFTYDKSLLSDADIFIVTVPTPIDNVKRPDLNSLRKASQTVGKALIERYELLDKDKKLSTPIVIYESTVFPGAIEEICVPEIEKHSGLKFNHEDGFYCGYSPERINPGDKDHRLTNIVKVTSGSSQEASKWVDNFYSSIIKAGTHKASNIKVAEAAKVIENTQRDLNIALINELAMICGRLGIDTLDVIEAASTKWNFLPFKPGLVGGHCIGVDPYYLTHKAEQVGYRPEVVLAGRRINDNMSTWLAQNLILELAKRSLINTSYELLILGLSFKENCPDLRNSQTINFIRILQEHNIRCTIIDPWVEKNEALESYGFNVLNKIPKKQYLGVCLLVAHKQFIEINESQWKNLIIDGGILYDLKGIIPRRLNPIRI